VLCSCQTMAGLKESAKEKPVGSQMHILRDWTVCLQAKLHTFSDIYTCSPFLWGLVVCLNYFYTSGGCSIVVVWRPLRFILSLLLPIVDLLLVNMVFPHVYSVVLYNVILMRNVLLIRFLLQNRDFRER
jgi:hypothetical protein